MRAVYLTGEELYIRAMVAGDASHATAWFNCPFPVNTDRAETWLKDAHTSADQPHGLHFAIVRAADDAVIGGVTLHTNYRKGTLRLHMAPWLSDADMRRAAALRLLHRWIRDDLELMAFVLHIPADQSETIAAAEALGMERGVRFREGVAR